MVHKWFTKFRYGGTSTNDGERRERPNEVTTKEMANKIHDIILDDNRMKICEIATIVNISNERVFNILREYLGMKKVSTDEYLV